MRNLKRLLSEKGTCKVPFKSQLKNVYYMNNNELLLRFNLEQNKTKQNKIKIQNDFKSYIVNIIEEEFPVLKKVNRF